MPSGEKAALETASVCPVRAASSEPEAAFQRAREGRASVYSRPFIDTFGNPAFQVQVPLVERGAFAGAF